MNPDQPLLVLFCGPNGAGKSTLRGLTLKDLPIPFINADEIAVKRFGAEQAEVRSYEAALLAESERQRLLAERLSFSFETVLSDPYGAKVAFLRGAKEVGYYVVAHFVGLDSSERSRARVIQRVQAGGHDVPDEKIESRYPRVIENLRRLLDVPDELVIYDNSSADAPYRVLAVLERGQLLSLTADIPAWLAPLDLPKRITSQTHRLS